MSLPRQGKEPPPGYDDETIIPKERLKLLTAQFEEKLLVIEDYITSELPGQFYPDQSLKLHLNSMNYAAKDLGNAFLIAIEELTRAYHCFEVNPHIKELNDLLNCLKKLQLLLST